MSTNMEEASTQSADQGSNGADEEGTYEPTEELLEHVRRPRNLGHLPNADVLVEAVGDCGDSIEVSINVKNGRIVRIGYIPRGCAFTLACASLASTLAEGQTLADARREVHPVAIDAGLGGLPEGHAHCASLASGAIWKAINAYLTTQDEPWKRLYR